MPLPALFRVLPRGGAILCLHGIRSDPQPDGGGIHVGVELFGGVLDVAAHAGAIVPLGDLLTRHESGKSTSGLVAITFDDACLSVQTLAAPLLRERGAPASIFAVRNAARTGGAFWWDRLSLLETRFTDAEWLALGAALGLADTTSPGRGTRARDTIVVRSCGALPSAAEEVFNGAEARLKVTPGSYDRSMTGAELTELARDPLFQIGVHTVTHRALPLLGDDEIRAEIADCHAWLRDVTPTALPVLAIPYGLRDERTRRLAQEVGMRDVLRIAPRTVRRGTTATGYPRFMVSERRSGWKLGAALLGVQEVLKDLGLRRGPDDPVMPAA
jgi:peptidoglycan/xylan/chitin deacetylase (PgdA/CDA1 family)